MAKHGDRRHLAIILTLYFLGLAAFLWIAAVQSHRPVHRHAVESAAAGSCVTPGDASDPGMLRHAARC